MLQYNRTLAKTHHTTDRSETWAWKGWHIAMKNRKLIDLAHAGLKNMIVRKIYKNNWSANRSELKFGKTFKQLYKERKKII